MAQVIIDYFLSSLMRTTTVDILPPGVRAANFAFDVTPARLVTGLVTERGVTAASRDGLAALYPERSV